MEGPANMLIVSTQTLALQTLSILLCLALAPVL